MEEPRELGSPFQSMAAYDEAFSAMGEELGRGASGVVRRATRLADGLGVAVKQIDLRALRVMGGISIDRLRREVDVMLGLRHRNIVELYGAYGDGNTVRLVMELVEGQELFDAILSRGKFDESEARPIFQSLCAAVAYMHGCGVIHRDLKPENVLLSPDGNSVKLVDFGLSKLVATGRGGSAAKTMVGTPSYLAPEIEEMSSQRRSIDLDQVEDGELSKTSSGGDDVPAVSYDNKVDAWSLGVTLYVMLIARFPVYRRTSAGLIAGLDLPAEARNLSPLATNLLAKLLEADPKKRFSVTDVLHHDPWLVTAVAKAAPKKKPPPPDDDAPVTTPEKKPTPPEAKQPNALFTGLASAHAALVAASALQLPPDMRRAGLVYHERVLASRALASKLRSTAGLVLEALDDLAFAVEHRQPAAAVDILANVKRWSAQLGAECAKAKADNLTSMQDIANNVSLPAPEIPSSNRILAKAPSSRSQTAALDLANDDDVLELMLPVRTTDDLGDHRLREPVAPVLKCLGELHVVFSRMELFWSKVELSLDTVVRRNESLEILLKFADSPELKSRFEARLVQFKAFWASLAAWDIEIVRPTSRLSRLTSLLSGPNCRCQGTPGLAPSDAFKLMCYRCLDVHRQATIFCVSLTTTPLLCLVIIFFNYFGPGNLSLRIGALSSVIHAPPYPTTAAAPLRLQGSHLP